jgi:hypothetical protein
MGSVDKGDRIHWMQETDQTAGVFKTSYSFHEQSWELPG